eukprot:Seg4164.1 transcript_id=Seg4164.1/GoldUCD/mRNA.D3Y31 product="Frataxin mitochondrial" protein_id=Seg4164.1/GoldUCD/D3Y31
MSKQLQKVIRLTRLHWPRNLPQQLQQVHCSRQITTSCYHRKMCSLFLGSLQCRRSPGFSLKKESNEISGRRYFYQSLMQCNNENQIDELKYEEIANITLELLADFFESFADEGMCPNDYDVQLSSGVLTVVVGDDFGIYVINKQSPNRQIWLSSPKSGPKRYDFIDGRWIYSHTGEDMNELLTREFSEILGADVDFTQLKFVVES